MSEEIATRRFSTGFAAGSDWSVILAAALADAWPPPEGANLGFLFASDHLAADFDAIVSHLREETGIADWSGTVGLGIATPEGELFDRPALAIMVAALPADSFRLFGPLVNPSAFAAREADWIGRQAGTVALLQADPRTPDLPALLGDFASAARAFTLGGLTASRGRVVAAPLAHAGESGQGLSGVLLGESIGIVSGLSQGCQPMAPAATVTAAEGQVIAEIDGRPALSYLVALLEEQFGARSGDGWPQIHPAFPLPGRDRDDYLVRNIVGTDPARGLIAVGELVEPGQKILFCRRDAEAARHDLDRMLADVVRRSEGRAKAGVYVSCVARGPNLFGPEGAELKQISKALGDIPLVGFYAGGEISGERLYGYTGVLSLFV